jgi:hypothetical protein
MISRMNYQKLIFVLFATASEATLTLLREKSVKPAASTALGLLDESQMKWDPY